MILDFTLRRLFRYLLRVLLVLALDELAIRILSTRVVYSKFCHLSVCLSLVFLLPRHVYCPWSLSLMNRNSSVL